MWRLTAEQKETVYTAHLRGVVLLNEREPEWRKKIRSRTTWYNPLWIWSKQHCVLAKLYGDFETGCERNWDIFPLSYGFIALENAEYRLLQKLWKKEIGILSIVQKIQRKLRYFYINYSFNSEKIHANI